MSVRVLKKHEQEKLYQQLKQSNLQSSSKNEKNKNLNKSSLEVKVKTSNGKAILSSTTKQSNRNNSDSKASITKLDVKDINKNNPESQDIVSKSSKTNAKQAIIDSKSSIKVESSSTYVIDSNVEVPGEDNNKTPLRRSKYTKNEENNMERKSSIKNNLKSSSDVVIEVDSEIPQNNNSKLPPNQISSRIRCAKEEENGYKKSFIKYGFTCAGSRFEPRPLCVICHTELSFDSMVSSTLQVF